MMNSTRSRMDVRGDRGRCPRRAWLLAVLCLAAPAAAQEKRSGPMAFRVGKVVSMDDRDTVLNDALVLVRDGKIESLTPARDETGAWRPIPEGYRVLEFPEHWLVPGMVDCHDHIAGSLTDLNDMVYQTNPGLDTRPTVQANNENIRMARTGGVTTVMLIPGSGTNMSGFGTIAKTGGDAPADVIVRTPGSLKIAQAGNPEWYFGGNNRSFMNWNTRQTLLKAKAYHDAWTEYERSPRRADGAGRGRDAGRAEAAAPPRPEFNPIWEKFRGLFQRDFPTTVHTQIYQVVMTTVEMLGKGLKLWVVLDHSEFDGWKVGPLVKGTDIWVICGPRGFHHDRMANRQIGFAAAWMKHGIDRVGVNTDAPVIPQEQLFYQAAMHCWYGWVPYLGLKGITSVPAKALGLYDRLGSIETGKDADFAIWTGDPLDPRSACLMTLVNGRIEYDAAQAAGRRPF